MSLPHFECTQCRARSFERSTVCTSCWGMEFRDGTSTGEGTVYTATRVFVSLPDDRWKDHLPYDVVLVDLDAGFQLIGRARLRNSIDKAPGTRVRARVVDGVPTFEEIEA